MFGESQRPSVRWARDSAGAVAWRLSLAAEATARRKFLVEKVFKGVGEDAVPSQASVGGDSALVSGPRGRSAAACLMRASLLAGRPALAARARCR
jgi:hypothetical protein